MKGICSKHQNHKTGCKLCEVIPPSLSLEKHRIGIINSKLRPILHKFQEGKMSLTLSLDKIHEVFKEDETRKDGKE